MTTRVCVSGRSRGAAPFAATVVLLFSLLPVIANGGGGQPQSMVCLGRRFPALWPRHGRIRGRYSARRVRQPQVPLDPAHAWVRRRSLHRLSADEAQRTLVVRYRRKRGARKSERAFRLGAQQRTGTDLFIFLRCSRARRGHARLFGGSQRVVILPCASGWVLPLVTQPSRPRRGAVTRCFS